MSKNIHWRLPFVSTEGTKYHVDIYDDYTGSILTISGGEDVLTTDESNSDDFFQSVRSQTGTLRIFDPDGTLLEQLVPENNTDRPIRLINESAGNTIVWQGFIKAEVYTQEFNGLPKVAELPIISVLEAMDSVRVDISEWYGFRQVKLTLAYVLSKIQTVAGIDLWQSVYYPQESWKILSKAINANAFYTQHEQANENSVTYDADGISLKAVIERVCTFMGWVARESGQSMYFTEPQSASGLWKETWTQFQLFNQQWPHTAKSIESVQMSSLEWMSDAHKKSVLQGAKSVEVIADTKRYNLSLALPECPAGAFEDDIYYEFGEEDYMYMLNSSYQQAYSNIQFGKYKAKLRWMFHHAENYGTTTLANVFSHMVAGETPSIIEAKTDSTRLTWFYAGAFHSRVAFDEGGLSAHDTKDGLYCVFFPGMISVDNSFTPDFDYSSVGPIFSIDSPTTFYAKDGYIKLSANAELIALMYGELKHYGDLDNKWKIRMELSIGNNWWNGSSWSLTKCSFNATFRKNNFEKNWSEDMDVTETDGLLIPINEAIEGYVRLKIWPTASDTNQSYSTFPLEMFFQSLDVSYVEKNDTRMSNRSENHYYKMIGVNFSDEITINSSLASQLDNRPSPSIVMNSSDSPMKTLEYTINGNTTYYRPEKHLLDRMAAYYGGTRHTLKIDVARPTLELPAAKMVGFDGKTYVPISESINWRNGISTITCMELPED